MKECLIDALEELKRAEHLMYVSLKYTRTVDMIKHLLERLMNSYECMFDGLLSKAKKEKKIKELPSQPVVKVEKVKEIYAEDEKIIQAIDFYLLLRKTHRAEFHRSKEFRRHVTMTVYVENEKIEIDIDKIQEYYKKATDFFEYLRAIEYD